MRVFETPMRRLRHACIFCGDTRCVVYKRLSTREVMSIVDRQLQAGMADPAVVLLKNSMQSAELRFQEDEHEGRPGPLPGASKPSRDGEPEDGSETRDDEEHAAAEGKGVHSCICCFHWINRRQDRPITLLPMQSLLYFMLAVTSCDDKKCDKRVLNRLTKSIGGERDNFWRSMFSRQELKAIEYINQKRESCLRTGDEFCIKREFAAFYHAQNGGGMLLASSSITDLIRSTHPPLCRSTGAQTPCVAPHG